MSMVTDAALRKLFDKAAVAETRSFAGENLNRLRRKGYVRSTRAEDYWHWRHELTPAGLAERNRVMERQ